MASFVRISFLLFLLLCSGGIRRSLLFKPHRVQRVVDAEISLSTGMLEYRSVDLHERHFALPGLRPGLGIVDCELIFEGVLVDSRETLDDLQVRAGSCEGSG